MPVPIRIHLTLTLGACGDSPPSTATPAPTHTSVPIPTSTATPTPTAALTSVPSATPNPTPAPVPTATLLPTPTPITDDIILNTVAPSPRAMVYAPWGWRPSLFFDEIQVTNAYPPAVPLAPELARYEIQSPRRDCGATRSRQRPPPHVQRWTSADNKHQELNQCKTMKD